MNVPKLRFKEFDGEWTKYLLNDLVDFHNNQRKPVKETDRISGEFPYYGASGIVGYVNDFIFEGEYLLLSEDGANIVSRNLPIVYKTKGKFWVNNHAHIFTSKSFISQEFLFQYLEKINYIPFNSGTAQPKLNLDSIKSIPLFIPKYEEQEKLSGLLRRIDKKIQLQQQKIDLLQEQKKGFLQKMFPKAGETQPEMRFDGFTENWKECKLGDVSNIIGGGTPSTSIEEYWNGNINWYSPVEIGEQIYVYESRKKITEAGLKKSSARILPIGTVLFTSRAGIGNTAILAREGCTNQGFQSIVPLKEKLDSYFIFSRTEELKRYAEINGAGSTFVEISGKQMSKMPILLPDLKEQKKIGLFFKRLDDEIILQKTKLNFIQQQKQGFMQQMFI